MKKLLINIKSLIDFWALIFFRLLFNDKNKKKQNENILYINTGQIGDLVISSKLLEYENIYTKAKIYFLINDNFTDLFKDYDGKIKIISVKTNAYRYNLLYRLKFNNFLVSLSIKSVYNLTSIRPVWNDTLALAIGASENFCFPNTWKTLIKFKGDFIDNFYSSYIGNNFYNEYERIDFLIENLKIDFGGKSKKNIFIFNSTRNDENFDIIFAPFGSIYQTSLSLKQIEGLVETLSNFKILILCSKEQEKFIQGIRYYKNVTLGCGKYKLNELFSVINKSRIFIGVDSGLTHIALKTKVKVIAVIGRGNYGRYLPKPDDNESIYLFEECEFANCEWYCKKEKPNCIRNVSVEQIVKAVKEIFVNENS